MSKLTDFVDEKNSWAAIFKRPQLSLDSVVDRQRIADMIDSALSPENLNCDGEISRAAANRKYKALTAAAAELLRLDPTVKMYEF